MPESQRPSRSNRSDRGVVFVAWPALRCGSPCRRRKRPHRERAGSRTMPRLLDNPGAVFVDACHRDVLAFGYRVFGRRFHAICHAHERRLPLTGHLHELPAIHRSNRAWQTNSAFASAMFPHLDRSHMSGVCHNASNPNHVRQARCDGEKDDSVRGHVFNSNLQHSVTHSNVSIKKSPNPLSGKQVMQFLGTLARLLVSRSGLGVCQILGAHRFDCRPS
jgi:hypothetical protein